MPSSMNSLMALLRAFHSPDVYNPWSDADPLDSAGQGPLDRERRLRAHFSCDPLFLLIGEAPGYQGCHFSGVPFTNERLILDGEIPRINSATRLTTRLKPWSEPSATIVWRTLKKLGIQDRAVLWNAFAWHPFKSGFPLSNRAPTRDELKAGAPALRAVLKHFSGVPTIAVGKVSEGILEQLGIPTKAAVRHPSMGGAHKFREGIEAVVC